MFGTCLVFFFLWFTSLRTLTWFDSSTTLVFYNGFTWVRMSSIFHQFGAISWHKYYGLVSITDHQVYLVRSWAKFDHYEWHCAYPLAIFSLRYDQTKSILNEQLNSFDCVHESATLAPQPLTWQSQVRQTSGELTQDETLAQVGWRLA